MRNFAVDEISNQIKSFKVATLMASIHVKSIGPIVDSGVLELRTLNVFIGKQISGKTAAGINVK